MFPTEKTALAYTILWEFIDAKAVPQLEALTALGIMAKQLQIAGEERLTAEAESHQLRQWVETLRGETAQLFEQRARLAAELGEWRTGKRVRFSDDISILSDQFDADADEPVAGTG